MVKGLFFLTSEKEHLDNQAFHPVGQQANNNTDTGLFVSWPNIHDLNKVGDDEYYQTECTATFMALLQQIDVALFPSVCTFLHGHILWADIVGSDPKELVECFDNMAHIPQSPLKSFAGRNRAGLMKQNEFSHHGRSNALSNKALNGGTSCGPISFGCCLNTWP